MLHGCFSFLPQAFPAVRLVPRASAGAFLPSEKTLFARAFRVM
jgi:hypothetical protein